jgi:hypothetical protein
MPSQPHTHAYKHKDQTEEHFTTQYVALLLFVYKHAYPDTDIFRRIQEECHNIQEGMTNLK